MAAETPDEETGALKIENTLLSRIALSWEVEEIDAETFGRLCRAYPEAMRKSKSMTEKEIAAIKGAPVNRSKRIVLYRLPLIGSSWWQTDVTRRENGDIAFCSGDSGREWYTIVRAKQVPAMRSALLRSMGPHVPAGASSRTLELIARKFSATEADGNPYDAIQSFLTQEGIKWKDETW